MTKQFINEECTDIQFVDGFREENAWEVVEGYRRWFQIVSTQAER
jgi:predicted nucleic acid-binding protein